MGVAMGNRKELRVDEVELGNKFLYKKQLPTIIIKFIINYINIKEFS